MFQQNQSHHSLNSNYTITGLKSMSFSPFLNFLRTITTSATELNLSSIVFTISSQYPFAPGWIEENSFKRVNCSVSMSGLYWTQTYNISVSKFLQAPYPLCLGTPKEWFNVCIVPVYSSYNINVPSGVRNKFLVTGIYIMYILQSLQLYKSF